MDWIKGHPLMTPEIMADYPSTTPAKERPR